MMLVYLQYGDTMYIVGYATSSWLLLMTIDHLRSLGLIATLEGHNINKRAECVRAAIYG